MKEKRAKSANGCATMHGQSGLGGNAVVLVGGGKVAVRHAKTRSHRSSVRLLAHLCPHFARSKLRRTRHLWNFENSGSPLCGGVACGSRDRSTSHLLTIGSTVAFVSRFYRRPRSIDFRPFCPMMDRGLFRRGNNLRFFVLAPSPASRTTTPTFRVSRPIERRVASLPRHLLLSFLPFSPILPLDRPPPFSLSSSVRGTTAFRATIPGSRDNPRVSCILKYTRLSAKSRL